MIFKFGKDKLSDFVKVIQFMEKEGIEFEGVGDLGFTIGNEPNSPGILDSSEPAKPVKTHKDIPIPPPLHNVGWEPWTHDGAMCNDTECQDLSHKGVHEV